MEVEVSCRRILRVSGNVKDKAEICKRTPVSRIGKWGRKRKQDEKSKKRKRKEEYGNCKD